MITLQLLLTKIHINEKFLRCFKIQIRILRSPKIQQSLLTNTRLLLTRWKTRTLFITSTYKKIFCSDGLLLTAYGLSKVYKIGCPFRIIISSIDNPLYSLFSQKIILDNISTPTSHIENSFQLTQKLNNISIGDNNSLISLDVISLFINVPIDLAFQSESFSIRWQYIEHCNIPKDECIKELNLVLNSTFFKFDNKIYKQKFDTPIGCPLSPILANSSTRFGEKGAGHDWNTITFFTFFYFFYFR